MPPHPLTNFETQKYYQNEPRFNRVYSRNNLPKLKDEAYVINLDEYESVESHWIALYVNGDNVVAPNDVTYFDSFKVEHITKEIKNFIGNKNITINIFRVQSSDSIMCGCFCIRFIGFMLKGKSLL